ncbi:hypothetical protein EGI11_09070 [Chryseobacterium sp. H3056]|uniref:DUF6377 domain-containing protein n=2 Tax=Kaistella daneshvariae TaxID=2487074 RepID=A0A3N0WUN0_9FLAO|nr:hypothetical protein EGI11_09070 [Kaistella daneshvariae]
MLFRKSKKFIPLFVVLLLIISCQDNSDIKNQSLEINKLDSIITEKSAFRKKRDDNIFHIKTKLKNHCVDLEHQYMNNREIADNYFGYQSDSVLTYLQKNLKLADATENKNWRYETLIRKSNLLNSIGLFTESKTILDSIQKDVPETLIFSYNATSESLYTNLYEYSKSNKMFADSYKTKLLEYYHKGYDSSKDPIFKDLFQYNIYKMDDKWEEASASIDKFINAVPEKNRLKAIGYYCKAIAEGEMGHTENQKKYLALSAIEDIESATTENRSIQELAFLLYKEGYYSTAYRFLESAIQDANFYNARFRTFQISKVQPIIEKAYTLQINSTNKKLRFSVWTISIMLIVLALVTYLVIRQLKIIINSRKELRSANEKLSSLNVQLDEANHIKEEYVAFFINQCSIYLERFERFKKLISKRLSMGQVDKLSEMVNNKKNIEMDLDELYQSFDKAFLRIYPSFVEEINKLLKPEERYPSTNVLNTELRIFALIRLGINDSTQISEFLRYSLRTIYNYRSKVKAKSVIENEDFEARIMQIGSISS